MRIDPDWLSVETLTNLVSHYVLEQEGSDYDETPFQDRVKHAKRLIQSGDILILFSQLEDMPFLITKQECLKRFHSVPQFFG